MTAPDVVVVGSGPSGVSAAWPLVRAGLQVLLIDASSPIPPRPVEPASAAAFRTDPEAWKTRFGSDLAGLAGRGDVSPKFATPLGRATLNGFAERLGLECQNFLAAGSLGRGGLSAIWGALAVRFDPDELHGWPVAADDLAASYNAIARRIGLGPAPEPRSEGARRLLAGHRRSEPDEGFRLESAPNAVIQPGRAADDLAERGACTECGGCLYGCGRGSIYASADELPLLLRHPNFRYQPGHLVRRVEAEGDGHRLMVEAQGEVRTLVAPNLILATGTLATTGLALDRLGHLDRPVRLLTNPAAAAAFVVPGLIGAGLPQRAVSLGQLLYRLGPANGDASAGVLYGADALPLDLLAARLPLGRPFALRLARALAPALVLATLYLPGRFSGDTIRVSRRARGAAVIVEGRRTDEATARRRADLARLRSHLARRGALSLPGSASSLQPGADAHYAGTLPMAAANVASGEPRTTSFGELAGCPGLFIADGACLPRLPAVHLTLTCMANADRISREIARRILAGERPAGERSARASRARAARAA